MINENLVRNLFIDISEKFLLTSLVICIAKVSQVIDELKLDSAQIKVILRSLLVRLENGANLKGSECLHNLIRSRVAYAELERQDATFLDGHIGIKVAQIDGLPFRDLLLRGW